MRKDVVGYEDYFSVDDKGNVFSKERVMFLNGARTVKKERKLTPHSNGIGYYQVGLTLNGKTSKKYVHRLVAEAFLEKPNQIDVFEVNHIDGKKFNNSVENLEWLTHSENIKHAIDTGLLVKEAKTKPCKQCGKHHTNKQYCSQECCTKSKGERYNKEQLSRDMMDLKSYLAMGRLYGVSDNAIRKAFLKHDLPLSLDYWKGRIAQ